MYASLHSPLSLLSGKFKETRRAMKGGIVGRTISTSLLYHTNPS